MQIYNKKAVTQNKLQHYKQINYINTPKKLQEKNRWVCHQNKIPINPHNGKNASCSDPTTWGNFQTAVEATNKYDFDGIGFQLGDGIVGIDLDNCFDEYGNLSYEARDIVDEANSYTEYSPSLRGLHIICEGNIPDGARKNTQKGFEIYSVGRYFTVTGNIFEKKKKIRMATKEMK